LNVKHSHGAERRRAAAAVRVARSRSHSRGRPPTSGTPNSRAIAAERGELRAACRRRYLRQRLAALAACSASRAVRKPEASGATQKVAGFDVGEDGRGWGEGARAARRAARAIAPAVAKNVMDGQITVVARARTRDRLEPRAAMRRSPSRSRIAKSTKTSRRSRRSRARMPRPSGPEHGTPAIRRRPNRPAARTSSRIDETGVLRAEIEHRECAFQARSPSNVLDFAQG
jgi:hypothetical protein